MDTGIRNRNVSLWLSMFRDTVNPCKASGSMGKSNADEMNIWTQEQYEQFSKCIQKSSVKLAFDMLFYTGMRSGDAYGKIRLKLEQTQ